MTAQRLGPVELRVLGCLIEKQRTTPEQYPLTLNSLRLACNQATNRDPVVDYDEDAGSRGGAAPRPDRLVAPGHRPRLAGREVPPPLRRGADARRRPDRDPRAADAPRAADRGRAEDTRRATARFSDVEEVTASLARLDERELVVLLPRRPGQREERWMHLLGEEAADEAPAAREREPSSSLEQRLARVEEQIAELTARARRARPTGLASGGLARFDVSDGTLWLQLSLLERFGASGRQNFGVLLTAVRSVRVTDDVWAELRGVRAPGTAVKRRDRPRDEAPSTRTGLRGRLRQGPGGRRRPDRRSLPPARRLDCRRGSGRRRDSRPPCRSEALGLALRDPRFERGAERFADRLELDPVEHVLEEAAHDQPLRLGPREAAAHAVEELLAVDLAERRAVRAADVVGHDLEAGDRVGVRVGESSRFRFSW